MEDLSKFISFLKARGIPLTSLQEEKLKNYYLALVSFSLKHNLISKNDKDRIIQNHFAGSFYFVKTISETTRKMDYLLDLGSGAGFPGIILAIFFANTKVIMIDSVRKKSLFLKRVVEDLQLNAEVINQRIEHYISDNLLKYDIITARSLAPLDSLLALCKPLLQNGVLHTVKGKNYMEEISKSPYHFQINEYSIHPSWSDYSPFLKNKLHLLIKAYG
jgi:16S rRNA (guanine527-N7)-methyltransferase